MIIMISIIISIIKGTQLEINHKQSLTDGRV